MTAGSRAGGVGGSWAAPTAAAAAAETGGERGRAGASSLHLHDGQ